MPTLTVTQTFYDLSIHRHRRVGEEFEASEARAIQIQTVLPGYVAVAEPEPVEAPAPEPVAEEPPSADLSEMTVAQLRMLASERGVAIPKGARKPDIVKLLEG